MAFMSNILVGSSSSSKSGLDEINFNINHYSNYEKTEACTWKIGLVREPVAFSIHPPNVLSDEIVVLGTSPLQPKSGLQVSITAFLYNKIVRTI